MSKGSNRRPRKISDNEELLRWELIRKSTTDERKIEIKEILENIKCGQ